MLLGELTWMEDEEFGLGDITRIYPRRLWIGSANGTFSSRFNLEMGCWQTQPDVLGSTQTFLTRILANSEDLDPDPDPMQPKLAEQRRLCNTFSNVLRAVIGPPGGPKLIMSRIVRYLDTYTTDGAPIAAASFARPGPTTLSPTSPGSGSSVGPSSAASSTNTSGLHKSEGQKRWPTSETSQA